MVACASAGDVEEMALGVVDVFQIAFVDDRLDSGLQRDHLVVTGGYRLR